MKTKELLEEWMQKEQRRRIKMQTFSRYSGLIDLHIVPSLGNIEICEMTRGQISSFLEGKNQNGNLINGQGLSYVSVNMMLSILKMAFNYAVDRELIESNPCERVRKMTSAKKRYVDAFTKEEQRKIEKAISEDEADKLFGLVLCFYTGLRIGELLGLEWSDLSEDCSILTVSKTVYRGKDENGKWRICVDVPKTESSWRRIPLPLHITRMLCELKKKKNSQYIICNKKGERMSMRSYQYIFEKLTEKAGVRKLNFHALRHTFATRALENGIDVKTVSEIMGHKNATLTLNRYAHSMLETKIAMMQKMTKLSEESYCNDLTNRDTDFIVGKDYSIVLYFLQGKLVKTIVNKL